MTLYNKYFSLCVLTISFAANIVAQPVLKNVFSSHFLVGAALNEAQFSEKDKMGAELTKKHFNTITPENVMKWEAIHPEPEKYNFEPADRFVEFGLKNNMFIVGHTLVWHAQTPKWVFEETDGKELSKEKLLERMKNHIFAVVGRYKGKIKAWDVVNEALNEDGTLRKSPWMNIIGEEYLIKAFQFAHEADPDAELYYNDYSVENEPKRNGAVALIKKLQAAGVKVHGIGMQGHYKMDWPTVGQIDSSIKAFEALGVKVMITELDIDILPQADFNLDAEVTRRAEYREKLNPYKKGLPEEKQKELAARYAELFIVFVKNSSVIDRVTFWGVEDGSSWLNGWPIPGRTSYPLLFDRNGKPKQAFDAVVKTAQQKL